AIQPAAPLAVSSYDVPRSVLAVRRFEHPIARSRVVIPAIVRFNIHRAEFPLPQWIVDPGLEPPVLFFLANFEPDFDQLDAGIDNILFDLRAELQKPFISFLIDKPHHMFDTGAVVPTAVVDDDFAGRGKMAHVTLHVHLAFLAIAWS